MRKTEIPSTETRITQSYFVKQHIDQELSKIIHSAKEGPIADLLESWKGAEKERIPAGLSALIMLMQSIQTPSDIISRIGWLNRYQISCPIRMYIGGDIRDHRRCRVFIEEGDIQIGIPEYWDFEEYGPIRRKYDEYCSELADIMGMPFLRYGYMAERELSHLFPTYQERYYKIRRHNVYRWKEIHTKYTSIDWRRLLTEWGLPEDSLKHLKYNITSHRFLFHLQHRLTTWSIDRWRNWFSLIIVQWVAGISPHGPLRTAWFKFNRNFMQGMISDFPKETLRSELVQTLLPQTLGRTWVEKYVPEKLHKDVGYMIQTIRQAAENLIQHTTWMSPVTTAHAIRKLRNMDIQHCAPKSWNLREQECGLVSHSLLENLLELSSILTDTNLRALKEKKCGEKTPFWDRPVYEVNAFYYPERNQFVLPAGILRPPYYDPKQSMAWNYGSLGSTIGHEICHGFDSEGRKYDEYGDLRDWWTEHDAREFKKREKKVVDLYESRPYRGMDVDGILTLVENIADLGGLEFALAAMKAHYGKGLTKKDMQDFFVSYTISWRSKDRLRKARQLLDIDPHAPPLLRVDHSVRQMDDWYEAFDVPADSPEYIPPDKRIHFFGY